MPGIDEFIEMVDQTQRYIIDVFGVQGHMDDLFVFFNATIRLTYIKKKRYLDLVTELILKVPETNSINTLHCTSLVQVKNKTKIMRVYFIIVVKIKIYLKQLRSDLGIIKGSDFS